MVRIPKGNVLLDGRKVSPPPASSKITFAQAVEMNPGPDWYYWPWRFSWTPEEAALLFLSEDPHISTFVRDNHRAFRQVMDELLARGYDQNKPPREWAKILLDLRCFGGAQKTTHQHHPFRYLSEYLGDVSPTPLERVADLERQLAEARQERDTLAAEVAKLRGEVGEAEGLAEVGSGNISDKQAEALRVLLMRREGKTVKEVGEALFPEVYEPAAQAQRVYRAQRTARTMLARGDRPAP